MRQARTDAREPLFNYFGIKLSGMIVRNADVDEDDDAEDDYSFNELDFDDED